MISEKMKINDCVTIQVAFYFVPVCFKVCSHLKNSGSARDQMMSIRAYIGITCNCPHPQTYCFNLSAPCDLLSRTNIVL